MIYLTFQTGQYIQEWLIDKYMLTIWNIFITIMLKNDQHNKFHYDEKTTHSVAFNEMQQFDPQFLLYNNDFYMLIIPSQVNVNCNNSYDILR